jgi:hypothetical protein
VLRVAALVVGVALAVGILWLAGEQHRENCIRDDRVSCSVLPWDNGEQPRLSERACRALLRAGAEPLTLPPECRR